VESNTLMASAMLEEAGARCTRYPFVKDDPALIRAAVTRAAEENDIVIVSAGSSAGTHDYTADVIAELGEGARPRGSHQAGKTGDRWQDQKHSGLWPAGLPARQH